jgi:hypothetical protein
MLMPLTLGASSMTNRFYTYLFAFSIAGMPATAVYSVGCSWKTDKYGIDTRLKWAFLPLVNVLGLLICFWGGGQKYVDALRALFCIVFRLDY